jgi:acyl-CoA thioesterase
MHPVDYRERDREWLGLETTDGGRSARLVVREDLVNPAGTLYGGTAVAAAVTLMESISDRFVVWTTVQFVSTCALGETLEMETVISAAGRRSSQLRVVARAGGREVFVALGALGTARGGDTNGQWEQMPDVPPPEDCLRLDFTERAVPWPVERSHIDIVDRRIAVPRSGDVDNQVAMWSRMPQHPSTSPAMLGWHADMLGMAVAKAKPGLYGGTSLDNTIRFGPPVDTEWVLVDLRAHSLVEGYGHGTVHVWAPDGSLVATGGQTCIVRPLPYR